MLLEERNKGAEGKKRSSLSFSGPFVRQRGLLSVEVREKREEGQEKDTDAQRRGKLWALGKQKQEVGGRHKRWGTDRRRQTDRQNKNTRRGEEKMKSSELSGQ